MLALRFTVSSHMKPYKSRAAWSCLVLRLTLALFFPTLLNGADEPHKSLPLASGPERMRSDVVPFRRTIGRFGRKQTDLLAAKDGGSDRTAANTTPVARFIPNGLGARFDSTVER
jgi:hypothetical protein